MSSQALQAGSSASSIAGATTAEAVSNKTTAATVTGADTAVITTVPSAITEDELKGRSDAELQSLRSMSASFFHVLRPFATTHEDTDPNIYLNALPFIAKIMRESVKEGSSVSSLLAILLPDDEELTVAHILAVLDTLETAVSIIRVEHFRINTCTPTVLHKNNVYYVMRQMSEFDIQSSVNKGKFQIPANHW